MIRYRFKDFEEGGVRKKLQGWNIIIIIIGTTRINALQEHLRTKNGINPRRRPESNLSTD
jgi:hypothetical protein